MENNKEAVKVDNTTTEASKQQEQPTAKSVPVETLAREWWKIEPEKLTDAQFKAKGIAYIYGSRNLTKMITFLRTIKVLRDDVSYWMDFDRFPLKRNEDELYEDYKIRQKFQNALIKYRREVKAFSIMNTLQSFIDEQKAKKEAAIADQIKDQNEKLETAIEEVDTKDNQEK